MKFIVFHLLLLIASIYGVLGEDDPVVINGKTQSDVPTPSTIAANITVLPPSPTTPVTPTTAPTTTTEVTTTSKKPITTIPPPPPPTTKPTTAPPSTTITTTTHTPNVTTEATTTAPTEAPSHKGRKFDGPSFIGGIILASGLMAICFVSWKFYKARTERNYHTL